MRNPAESEGGEGAVAARVVALRLPDLSHDVDAVSVGTSGMHQVRRGLAVLVATVEKELRGGARTVRSILVGLRFL